MERYTRPSPNWLEHTTERAVHTTEPAYFANKRCLQIAYIGNYAPIKVVRTVHAYSIYFNQHASFSKLDTSRYWAFMLICHSLAVYAGMRIVELGVAPVLGGVCLTHWGRDKMDAISQTTFSNAISWISWLKFHWSLFLRVQLTISQHWFR